LKGEGENNAVLKEVMLSERFLTKLMNNHRNQINLEEEINRNMKGKFKLLGHIGLALFLVSALILVMAPVAQASSVSSVWMEFETAAHNNVGTEGQYTIHFTTGTALSRGVDTITVVFPDGLDSTMGPTTTQDSYDFELGSADTTASYYEVDPTGDPLGTGASYVACTAVATIAGYRVQVTTPVDIPASTAATLRISASAVITTPAVAASTYKIKLATSQDTSFVLSSAFPVDNSVLDGAPTAVATYPSSLLAGAASAYKFNFNPATDVPIGGTVTVEFPVGTYLPSTIDTANVYIGDDSGSTGDDPHVSAVSVDTAARTVTATTAEATGLAATAYIYFTTSAGIKNPTTIGDQQIFMWTSTDGQKIASASDIYTIAAGTATKLAFTNDSTLGYSDDATILYAFTDKLYIDSVDEYGHKKAASPTEPTIALSVVTGSGAFYTAQSTASPYSNTALSSGILGSSNEIYYRPTSAGTHTLKAEVVSGTSLTEATWTVYVAPAVVLKDANSQTIGTYGPASTSTADYTYGGAWIQAAIDAAFPGDTVELGGSSGAPAIYELSAYINLDKKVTLTSTNGASYTTLRPVDEPLTTPYNGQDVAVVLGVTGTAAYPVVIDGLTFTRLRLDDEFDIAIYNNGYNYVTVQNCTFNYIKPDYGSIVSDHEYGSVLQYIAYPQEAGGGDADITAGTISNNTFTNCCSFALSAWGEAPGNISVMAKSETGQTRTSISGVTVSGNTITNCSGHGIWLRGYNETAAVVTATVTDNTITNAVCPITLGGYTTGCSILRNTVTGGYMNGLWVGFGVHNSVVIKNNTITGCAGTGTTSLPYSCAIYLIDDGGAADEVTVQYNDIYDNDAAYSIYATSDIAGEEQHCQYNYYGDATGPYYSALSGATVSKSNTGGAGKKVSDLITYYPWLHKSRADVVADNASYQACTMSLVSGWNTLSTPVKLISTADSIDELIPSGMTIGYYYDATGWQQITTGKVLSPCDAVYVKMSAATDVLLKFDASAYTTPSKALNAGWNLISLAYLSSSGKQADDAVASVYLTAAGLPGYSQVVSPSLNATQTNMFGVAGASWAYSSGQTIADPWTETMYAGLGYWCYMQNAATLAGFEITPIAPDLD
jgi:hypothetical protein